LTVQKKQQKNAEQPAKREKIEAPNLFKFGRIKKKKHQKTQNGLRNAKKPKRQIYSNLA
jgi:hypothetical protein